MQHVHVRLWGDYDWSGRVLAQAEAETFDLCRFALFLSGEVRKSSDGFFIAPDGQRVTLCWEDTRHGWSDGGLDLELAGCKSLAS